MDVKARLYITWPVRMLTCRYKAEVDVDGRELALYYLRKKNMRNMLGEVNAMKTEQELETFLLQHGENIVDCLGEQVLVLIRVYSLFKMLFDVPCRWTGLNSTLGSPTPR